MEDSLDLEAVLVSSASGPGSTDGTKDDKDLSGGDGVRIALGGVLAVMDSRL